ncbi:methionyl-tRNA formyltransferase [Burkholderia glumae]|uniref:Methionyl-tRNA formyltransferase n=1 Tax=Burkholderia glumae TaxID=337 RepID=A0AAQ0BTP5_BURGL|nr:methionyl-tRNA formyltransferase [Burkholderia glumae]ACR30471.1 Methionyl-tRNA formyltransferase [Burkholderia glumae BGR1]AJY65094.1 methionyl-tRNA formyltransferase [Burkholderia glumae LMG 2196 = ATCC 33617]KHJ63660.1 methionyl-tRNA formyltransferase [Burkholderia glumae]MCM2481877.1 methionyl-tRNA formyltransferase [Burkholderia glumae]MCM2507980.1 methionyl-tRNA formyltransferase [Burkholderia glumae]
MTHSLRVIFAGTPEFAAAALAAIHEAGFAVPLVLTQPDRPAGRGMKLQASAVKRYALDHGMPVAQPPSLRRTGKYPAEAAEALDRLRATPHDVMVVAAYGLLLPQEVLEMPPRGCINIHASLLPRWRGAAPIHRALEAGDAQTGVTLMQMDVGLDTGAMLSEGRVAIAADETTASLHDKLAQTGARLIVEALVQLERDGELAATPQPADGVTYAEKIGKHEAALDWREPAAVLARRIRAFDPFPGGAGTLDGTVIKLWAAEPVVASGAAEPGTIVEAGAGGVVIACGEGALRVTQLQKPGGKRLPAREFLAGAPLAAGQRFALPEAG